MWKHEDCFPTIYDIILDLCRKKKDWVLHDEIVAALLDEALIIKLVTDVRMYKDMEEREIVANMVAWFSQKVTEYENGNLPANYRQFYLIEEAYRMFDRKKAEGRYAYRLRYALAPKIPPKIAHKGKAITQEQIEEMKKREEFRKYVESLKKQRARGEISAEEYRKRTMEWWKTH